MQQPFFKPWKGSNYAEHRTVILSESAYDWSENGQWFKPPREHPIRSVEHAITHENHARFFMQLTRAICEHDKPSTRQREKRWNDFAYTIYVQQSVGRGARVRPKADQWSEAKKLFPRQIDGLEPKPRKMIITGKSTWNNMPDCKFRLLPDLQAYEDDGELLWCLALPHTANSVQGFDWREIGHNIRVFMAVSFPTTIS